jgi:hypothetical protein
MNALKNSILKIAIAVIILTILLALGAFVWPTRYKYDRLKMANADSPVRIDRLTGKTEILYPSGWHGVDNRESQTPPDQDLPGDELAKLTGQAQITSYGWVEFELYNGSSWTISETTVLVEVLDAQGKQIISRPYRLIPEDADSQPQSSEKFHASLGFALARGQTWSFSVTGAKGRHK